MYAIRSYYAGGGDPEARGQIAQTHAQQEAIELCLGQRESAFILDRVS